MEGIFLICPTDYVMRLWESGACPGKQFRHDAADFLRKAYRKRLVVRPVPNRSATRFSKFKTALDAVCQKLPLPPGVLPAIPAARRDAGHLGTNTEIGHSQGQP